MKKTTVLTAAVALLVACAAVANDPKITYESTELAPGIIMLEGVGGFAGGNLGILTGKDGVVLIDDGMSPLYDTMIAAIHEHVGDIDFVVNTHVHGDHIGNNARLSKNGAMIVAHDRLRSRMISDGVTGPDGDVPPTAHDLPEITFSDSMTFHLNGHRVHVVHVAKAHTDGDAFVYFPDADVIHSGDVLFNGMFPYIDLDSGGSVDGYLAAQDRILELSGKDTKIISGHGPMATKADLQAARDMIADARDRVRKLVADGMSEADILAANPLADYDRNWTWGFITTERMTEMLVKDSGIAE